MAQVQGIRTTDNASTSFALMKRSVYDAIYDFKPYQTPITQFMMANKRNKIAVGNPKFEVIEDIHVPITAVANSVAASGTSQTLTLSAGGYQFPVGAILRNTSNNENMRVVTVTSDTSIDVTALDNSTALSASTSPTLMMVGFAGAEGSGSAVAVSTVATQPYNYTQILKRSVHMTGTQMASVNYGMSSDWTHQRIKATEQFKLDIERMSMYGIRNINTAAGAHVRFSSGLLDTTSAAMGIADVSQYIGTVVDEDYFFKTFCKNLFAKGSNMKTMYVGSDLLLTINDFAKVKQQTKVSEKEYGVDVQTILTPFGKLSLVWMPLLEGNYSNWGVAVDRDGNLKYAYLSGNGVNRDIQWQDNIQTPDEDERKAQYLAEAGLWLAGGGQGIHRTLYPGASA